MRFYILSAQIRLERKHYYNLLERTQKCHAHITGWILWFLQCLIHAIAASEETLSRILQKAEFWKRHATTLLNDRQQKIINKLLDGYEGKLTTAKWAKINNCSQDTALRDMQDLIAKGVLLKDASGGRSTYYVLRTFQEVKGGQG